MVISDNSAVLVEPDYAFPVIAIHGTKTSEVDRTTAEWFIARRAKCDSARLRARSGPR